MLSPDLKRIFRGLLTTLALALIASVNPISAQVPIPVGAGSYASFPPASAGGTAIATSTQSLYVVSTNTRPVPSNKWWTDLVIHQYAGYLWAYPLMVSADSQGVNIYNPTNFTGDGAHQFLYTLGSAPPISIHGQGFTPADSRALNWGDWTVAFRMQQSTNQFMDVTIGHGLPCAWIEFTGISPQIKSSTNATYFDDNGNPLSFPLSTNHFGITYSGKVFAIFAPDNTQFARSNDTLNVTFSGASSFLVVGAMPSQTNLAFFSQFAYAVPRDSQMNWAYDPAAATVTTSWHLTTQPLQGAEPRIIQGWIPHHWRNPNNFAFNGIQYNTPRGLMKTAAAADFQIVYKFNGILPTLPAPVTTSLSNDYVPSRMNSYITSVAADTAVAAETYAGGKDMLRYAQHMVFANLMNRPEFSTLENTLRNALTDWYTFSSTSDGRYFAFYPAWKALVGFPPGFGSDQFNDHHFHYGYFAHATALLGMYDQNFLTNYGPMAKLVAKEYANWDRSETNFPFLRTFDIWGGHSDASGFSDSLKGNNQESSSEAMQSWGGLFLLGAMLGDDQMRAAGAMGYAMESEGVRQYYFNVPKFTNPSDSNWQPAYTRSIVGILWDSGQEYQTYFGLDPVFIHGIQWLPPSPIMSYQVEDPAFAQQDYNNMLTERGATAISPMGSQWGNYALGYAAQFNPDYSAAQLDQLFAASDPVATDVTYAGATYYQTHSTRALGAIQWNSHMDIPTSAVYFNTNTAQYSFIAYNPKSTRQIATVYRNNSVIGHLTLPAFTLVNQSTIDTNGITTTTNIVPALVQPGVQISWSTVANTNYTLQSSPDVTTNAVWTNQAGPIPGDGATNSVFDPFGPATQKFYRVLRSP